MSCILHRNEFLLFKRHFFDHVLGITFANDVYLWYTLTTLFTIECQCRKIQKFLHILVAMVLLKWMAIVLVPQHQMGSNLIELTPLVHFILIQSNIYCIVAQMMFGSNHIKYAYYCCVCLINRLTVIAATICE